MNAELKRIRQNKDLDEIIHGKPNKIDPDILTNKIYMLNTNMTDLYNSSKLSDSVELYIEKFTENIYLVLEMFNDMGVYPDYFYDIIVKMNIVYRNLVMDGKIRGNYELYKIVDFSSKISQMIKEGLNDKRYQYNAAMSKDISEYYVEMISFFERFNLPYKNSTIEDYKRIFEDIYYNINNITNKTLNSDFIFLDIECLSRLLFEYISFFAAIGVNPKKYLDEYIEKEKLPKTK